MKAFEETVAAELAGMLHAGVPVRGVRITVYELVVERIGRGPLDARHVAEAVDAAVRAACRLVREMDAPEDFVNVVCGAALAAVRGHGGQSARWLDDAIAVLDDLAREHAAAGAVRAARD
jgi:hypothetical protein